MYLPLYLQTVQGVSALVAGFALAALTLGWPLAASNSGRLYLRLGFRDTGLIGAVLAIAGNASLLLLGPSSHVLQAAASCFVVGLGLGLIEKLTESVQVYAREYHLAPGHRVRLAFFRKIMDADNGSARRSTRRSSSRPRLRFADCTIALAGPWPWRWLCACDRSRADWQQFAEAARTERAKGPCRGAVLHP